MRYLITTDTHFGHKKLVTWGRDKDFELLILKNLHKRAKDADILIHLGDFCIGHDELWHDVFMNTLPPGIRKILIRGNHDNKSNDWYYEHGWDVVLDQMILTYNGKKILFTHIPMFRNDEYHVPNFPPDIQIHGHFHGNSHRPEFNRAMYDSRYCFDVAPDQSNYEPYTLDEVITRMDRFIVKVKVAWSSAKEWKTITGSTGDLV